MQIEYRGKGKKESAQATKTEIHKVINKLPAPLKKFNLTPGQKYWYMWIGKELVATGIMAKLDVIHVVKAAIALDKRNQAVAMQNKLNKKNPQTLPGFVQTYATGATNISPWQTIIKEANKDLDDISRHFGLSMYDRQKLQGAPQVDPAQTSLFEEFNNLKKSM